MKAGLDEGVSEGRDEGRRDERNAWMAGGGYRTTIYEQQNVGRREELWTVTLGNNNIVYFLLVSSPDPPEKWKVVFE